MYKLIIADDERRIREGLKKIVDWEQLGFVVTELFQDGQEVIEYLDYMIPDVILTDIKMNFVSGLDVAKYVYENELPCKVILISGYQEFEQAIAGLRYGAADYLLKPTNVDQIQDTFLKIKKQLDEKQAQLQKERYDRERTDEAIQLLEERFFADIVMGVMESREYIQDCMGVLYPNLDIGNCRCFLADLYIENYEYYMNNVWEYSYDQLEMNLRNFLKIYEGDYRFHIVYKTDNLIELLAINTGNAQEPSFPEQFCLDGLLKEMEQSFGFRAKAEIRQRYDDIYHVNHLREKVLEKEDDAILGQYIKEQKKLVTSNIAIGNIVTAQKLYHNIVDEVDKLPVQKRNNIVIDILSTINDVLWETNEQLAGAIQPMMNYSDILSMTRIQDILNWSDRLFDRIRISDNQQDSSGSSLVARAKNYIKENIYRDISQEELANSLYICPSYLSRLFRKQTGEGFLQCVTRMKMEKAIELLREPQYKTYQVGDTSRQNSLSCF